SEELFLPGSRLSEPFRALSGPRYTRTGAKGSVGLQFSHESVLLKTHALYQWLRLVDGRFCGAPSVSAGSFPPTQARWLDKWAKRAIKEDPRLLNHDWLCESIYRNRYGEDRLQRRISLRKKQGTPLWGVDPKQKRPARKRGAS